jgi:DNA end-binding protein Ku
MPVRLYPAIKRRGVRFRELDRRSGQRVRHQRVGPAGEWQEPRADEFERPAEPRPADDEAGAPQEPAPEGRPERWRAPEPETRSEAEVPPEQLVRGYEFSPGRFVQVTEEELAELAPERTKTIDVEQFVSRGELDPVYFESSYYVVPDRDLLRPFAVLLRAMQQTNHAAICWIVLRTRRHLAVLQPRGPLMLLTTLLFSDEVVPSEGLQPVLPDDLQEREIEMAELLVRTLAGPWEPERYRDEYREKVLALVEGRAAAQEFVEETEPGRSAAAGVEELLAALKASVEEARARRGEHETKSTRRRRGA